MTIDKLFYSDPTRQLEEVQKVTDYDQLETDVREFHETDSAERVLTQLGDIVRIHPNHDPRFLYIEATFGSGKTHLLKLVGLVVDDESEFDHLGERLAEKWTGFDNLARAVDESHVDRLKPVFLNLLDRDASKEPPLPFLIYEAIGRELGYPTDPNWLLEWAWRLDMEHDEIWQALQEYTHDGKTFEEVLEEKAFLRTWLYDALPSMSETNGTDLDTTEGVKASIDAAESDVEPEAFDPEELVQRIETVTEALNEGSKQTELLLGLDEVALFVGDSQKRYREFEATMDALQHGPNPPVVATGQYSLPATRESLIGESGENHWTSQQVKLEGADTEIIVRERWLEKNEDGKERVSELLEAIPDLSLSTYTPIESADPDSVKSYPFREYDLTLLRTVMQELITQGRETDRDYIQGRALLVLVRSLFTKFGWATKDEGRLVTWDVLFDLLVEETPYLPFWIRDMMWNTVIPTFDGDERAWEVRVAKALYLLNQAPGVPSTPENLGRLMFKDVSASLESTIEKTADALETLEDKKLALTETTDQGDEVYTLVSEEQENVLSRGQTKAEQVSPHQLSAWLETRIRENDDFFRSDGTRHEIDVGEERLVPLRYEYSVREGVDRAPGREFDALQVRILADDPDTIVDQVNTWQDVNAGRDGSEHILITIDVPEPMLKRVRNVIGMGQVLDEETESHEELEREHRKNKRQLESSLVEVVENASVYTVDGHEGDRGSVLKDVISDQVRAEFGSTRKTLSRPLVEVEDAKDMAQFFRGEGDWPLTDADAVLLGVDTATGELADDGWAREFIEQYEPKKAVDVESLLQKTRTANGDYRGTPRESIAALLITLATSNEAVTLKQDTEYLQDPATIGRQVATKGGLTSLQVRFDVVQTPAKEVRELVRTVLEDDPRGDGPDEWMAELGTWVQDNSVAVKRTLKRVEAEFDVSLDAFEATIKPALEREDLSTTALGGPETMDATIEDAKTFITALKLFTGDGDEPPLWEQFTETVETMSTLYPSASITSRMQATAESTTVPSEATVRSRLEDAEAHRLETVSEQYRRITGTSSSKSALTAVCTTLTEWVRDNETAVRDTLEEARETFEEIVLDDIKDVFAEAWTGDDIQERDVVEPAVIDQAKTYEQCRELFDRTDEDSLWEQLENAHEQLREEYPRSPTTTSVESVLGFDTPPTVRRVRSLLEEADDPRPPITGDSAWAELKQVADELRQELPNADITDEVTDVVDADDRPSEERTNELLSEARTVLERMQSVQKQLDDLEEYSIVVIDRSE